MRRMLTVLLLWALAMMIPARYVFAGEEPKPLAIGAKAPDFKLPGVDGKDYTLSSFKQYDILVMVFTCNHCPTSQAYEDRIKQLVTDYSSKGVGVVAISPNSQEGLRIDELGWTDLDDSFEHMKIRARDKQFNFPYLYDGDNQKVSREYGPIATPHVFVFDKDRKLRYQGRIDDTEKPTATPANTDTRNAIEALLAKREVPVTTTKVFGCSTKWIDKSGWVAKEAEDWAKKPVTLETIDEDGIRELLKNNSGKLRLINIWATWCGPCVTEFPEFVTMYRMYQQRDFEFISITADEISKKDKALEFLKKNQAAHPNYIFNGKNKYSLIEAVDPNWQGALPYTILVEPGGKIVYARQNIIDPLAMRKLIIEHPMMGRTY